MHSIHPRRLEIIVFLQALREELIESLQKWEDKAFFKREAWSHKEEGGGEIALLRGSVLEKAAVNWSGVGGKSFPLDPQQGSFFATGISLITHMMNPHAPTAHFNLRFIETKKSCWFGGGYDLTPMGFPYEEDTLHFHKTAKHTLDAFNQELYPQFSQQARDYFYIPHRHKERGIGGIFFDLLSTSDFDADYSLWKGVGASFLEALFPIYERRVRTPFSPEEKELQLIARSHYAEFNLVYDRGTAFGFKSQGNPTAILSSMPPLVKW